MTQSNQNTKIRRGTTWTLVSIASRLKTEELGIDKVQIMFAYFLFKKKEAFELQIVVTNIEIKQLL